MAASVVTYLLEKLGDAVVQDALRLHGVGKQVEKVLSRDLRRMQAFLQDADSSRNLDARQKQLVMEVRDLAYSIEDVIDTYLLQQPEKKPGKREAIMRIFLKTKKIPALHKLADEVDAIQARIKEIKEIKRESTVTRGTNNLGDGGERKPLVPPNYDDPDVVAFENDRKNIVRLLLDQSSSRRRSVISIVGTGGLGKTTLARKVFNSNEVKLEFPCHVWSTVSQTFDSKDILRKIAQQVGIELPKNFSEHDLTRLYEVLKIKKYLIVLDDIWTPDAWTQIKGVLPDVKNGSRILVTTRKLDIAQIADPKSQPYKLAFLTHKSSLELLLKKALQDDNEACPTELSDIANQLTKKCKGLPLALEVLGGLLLLKGPPSHAKWSTVLDTLDWDIVGDRCIAILSASYDDLPFALKSCFNYFAAFPEDVEIDAEALRRMWIAEGFIPQQRNKTLEDTTENFLDELVQRSMVQVARRSRFSGSISHCRVHDLLRELAIRNVKDDNFLMSCSKMGNVQSCSRTRRLAISCEDVESAVQISESIKSSILNLRSLLVFTTIPNFTQHKLLKVLSIGIYDIEKYDVEISNSLGQLRYCELGWGVNFKNKYIFQKFFGGMKFIQTLDLRRVPFCFDLPDGVWYVKTLRHVILPTLPSTDGPPPSAELRNLQTLIGVRSRKSWEEQGVPKLPNVKELDIRFECNTDALARFLCAMEHLTSLTIHSNDLQINLIDMRGFLFYQKLQFLYLRDYSSPSSSNKPVALDYGIFPIHLCDLSLRLNLEQDPMPVLKKLENLELLLLEGPCKIQQIRCSAGGFGKLQWLEVSDLEEVVDWKIEKGAMPVLKSLRVNDLNKLVDWKIEKGAMPVLRNLAVRKCPQLRVPDGLQYLTDLETITWRLERGDPRESEIRSLCKHVPTIIKQEVKLPCRERERQQH